VKLLLIPRQPLRINRSGRRVPVCESRGYCGPFANEALYDAFPEPMWHGMGDCLECGTTCHVAGERKKPD
jgi:hypothetical protein